jgi:hypothetical protein
MDYVDAFRPIFAYAAHLAASTAIPDAPAVDADAAGSDLSLLLGEAMRFRNEPIDPNFDQAWFALSAWLDGTLRRLPGCAGVAARLVPADESRERDFFRRLDLLLMPLPSGYPREIRAILRVYGVCLDLGGYAFHGNPEALRRIGEYRERCLGAVGAPSPSVRNKAAARPERVFGGVTAAAVWIAAAAAPLALYCVYRFLLGGLYASVVG